MKEDIHMDAATIMEEQLSNKSYASELCVCSLRYDLDERPYEKTTDIGSVNLVPDVVWHKRGLG